MHKKTSTVREIKVGDLVYHLLHGKEWVGLLLEIIDIHKVETEDGKRSTRTEIGLVKMQPGTKHENFFAKMVTRKNRVSDSLGFVSTNWLFKLEEKRE